MGEKVWEGEFGILESQLFFTPKRIIDRNDLINRIDPLWISGEVERAIREWLNIKFLGRIGGGVLPVIKSNSEIAFSLLQRTEDAPRSPSSYDICAGMGDASLNEISSNVSQPIIPILIRILSEMYELIPKIEKETYIAYYPINIEERILLYYLWTTAKNTIALINLSYKNKKPSYTTKILPIAEIGEFSNGKTITEYNNKGEEVMRLKGVIVTQENNEKSVEVISPLLLNLPEYARPIDTVVKEAKVRAGLLHSYYDGEHTGNFDRHDLGLIPEKSTLLNRYVGLIYPDGYIKVYKSGDVIYEGSISTWSERSGLVKAIKEGKSEGMTSKVKKLCEEAYKGTKMRFSQEEISLYPLKVLRDEIMSIIQKK